MYFDVSLTDWADLHSQEGVARRFHRFEGFREGHGSLFPRIDNVTAFRTRKNFYRMIQGLIPGVVNRLPRLFDDDVGVWLQIYATTRLAHFALYTFSNEPLPASLHPSWDRIELAYRLE